MLKQHEKLMDRTCIRRLRQAALLIPALILIIPVLPAQPTGPRLAGDIRAGYAYGMGGESWFRTPEGIHTIIHDLGYNATVEADLSWMAGLWQKAVNSHTYTLEYTHPLRPHWLRLIVGGMYRRETARGYGEADYDPAYVFSGVSMTSSGGGLYAGTGAFASAGRWLGSMSFSMAWLSFRREFLHTFYLDPLMGGSPLQKQGWTDTYFHGPGLFVRITAGYRYQRLSLQPQANVLLASRKGEPYGNLSAGILATYNLEKR